MDIVNVDGVSYIILMERLVWIKVDFYIEKEGALALLSLMDLQRVLF